MHDTRVWTSFIVFTFRPRQSPDQWQMTFDDPLDKISSSSMCSIVFYFCGFINSGEFLYERFINYWSSHVKYEPVHEKICPTPYANNKGADQPAHPHSLMSTFVVLRQDSIILIIAKSKISRL